MLGVFARKPLLYMYNKNQYCTSGEKSFRKTNDSTVLINLERQTVGQGRHHWNDLVTVEFI